MNKNENLIIKRKLFLSICILFCLFFSVKSVGAEVKTQKITNLEEPTWVFKTGMSRARYHDRQDLGIVLNAGATIKIRKLSTSDGYANLKIWFLGDNRKIEKSATITSQWKTITIGSSSVPFITTPSGSSMSEIEYEVEGSVTKLPIFNQQDNEDKFFSEWDDSQAAFSLIKSDKFQLLIPLSDKNKLKELPDFESLADYIVYQDSIITYYDKMMGLTDAAGVHKTPKNRFFLKGDGGTPSSVAAYYNNRYTANGKSTVVDRWMKKWDWGTLHELGHGYQPAYTDREMYTDEVSNNLLAILFTYEHRGKIEGDTNSWLYNFGKKSSIEDKLYGQLITSGKDYDKLDYRGKLILLTNLTQSVGKDRWIYLNKLYREAVNNGDVGIQNMSLPDLFTFVYSQQTNLDYSPVFGKWGLTLTSTRQPTISRENSDAAVASLIDVVPKDRLSKAVTFLSSKLLVDSQFSLVTNEELASLQLPGGELTIHFKIDEFDQLKGKLLKLKNGQTVIREFVIDSQDLKIPNLGNGIYTLAFPETEKFYSISNYYAYVRDENNETTINFNELKGSQLFDEKVSLKGEKNKTFATLQTDFQNQKLVFDIVSDEPHSSYAGKPYAEIEVLDETGKQIYQNMMEGTNVQAHSIRVELKEGYQIKIFHTESISQLTATTAGLIDPKTNTNVLFVKNGQLVNQSNSSTKSGVNKIIAAIDVLKTDTELSNVKTSPEKTNIIIAILALPEAEREALLAEYQDLLNLKPGVITINYIDENGASLSPSDSQIGRFGETRVFQAKVIKGYDLKETAKTIHMTYKLKSANYDFVYIKKTEKIEDDEVSNLPVNNLLLKDVQLIQGEKWYPEMNVVELIKDNKVYAFTDAVKSEVLTYTPSELDTSKLGTYEVSYTYHGITQIAKVSIRDKIRPALPNSHPEDKSNGVKLAVPAEKIKADSTMKNKNSIKSLPKTSEQSSQFPIATGVILLMLSVLGYFKYKQSH